MVDHPACELLNLTFSYGGTHADSAMVYDCAFEQGKITAIMGASGSGKSTLLSLIAGFERASSGTVMLEGEDMTLAPPAERPLSMVFQDNNLFAHLNIHNNVALGISALLKLKDSDIVRVGEALSSVGLDGYDDRMPANVSGGQRQRVALARVLVRKKPILLLDEAFGSLGPGLREEMLDLVSALTKNNGMTSLMVTHEPEDALRVAQKLVFLDGGRVVFSGSVDVLSPNVKTDPHIAAYLGGGATK